MLMKVIAVLTLIATTYLGPADSVRLLGTCKRTRGGGGRGAGVGGDEKKHTWVHVCGPDLARVGDGVDCGD